MDYITVSSVLRQWRLKLSPLLSPLLSSRFVSRWLLHGVLMAAFLVLSVMTLQNLVSGESEQSIRIRLIKERTESMMRFRLRSLQKTMFKSPIRPADHTYNINVTLSEATPLERDVIDSRPPACRNIIYDLDILSNVTVIIPFYNEALSMLLRTVHSILRKTPPRLLAEIILIDDHSPNLDLQTPLADYVRYISKLQPSLAMGTAANISAIQVKLLRTRKREGLIRARLIGARMAKGQVLIFLDAHTEVNVVWLEPMLEEIRKHPQTVIQPHIDQIDPDTIEYNASGNHVPRGGFSWDLRYVWMEMPEHEKQRLSSPAQAHRTVTIVGCAIAVQKEYFYRIGTFDSGMNVWGGENIELAFRTWMCGGQVLTHPCTRVAHTFKPFSYSFDGDLDKIVEKNLIRIAELWMGDYKEYFYASTWNWPSKRTSLTGEESRTLQLRRDLKEKLKCKDFEWFMKAIIPELDRPPNNALYFGEFANIKSEACLHITEDSFVDLTYFCFFHRVLPNNQFTIDKNGIMKYKQQCVVIDKKTVLLKLVNCNDHKVTDKWSVDHTSEVVGVVKMTSKEGIVKCLTQVTNVNNLHKGKQMVQLLKCRRGDEFQRWRFQYKFRFDHKFPFGATLSN